MQVRFYAAARAAAGTAEVNVPLEALGAPTVGALTAYLAGQFTGTTHSGLTLGQVMAQCSFLVEGARCDADAPLTDYVRVDVLPPFAGG